MASLLVVQFCRFSLFYLCFIFVSCFHVVSNIAVLFCCTACRIISRGGYTIATRWGGHDSDCSVGPGYFFFHPSGFLVFLFYLLFVKFVSITFGSQPCRTHSHQREIPTTYRLCWVLSGFGLVGLDWVGVRQHGLGWSWVGLEPHITYIETHCFCWVALGLVGVGFGWV